MRKQSRLMKRRCSLQLFSPPHFSPNERSLKLCHDKNGWLANSLYYSVVLKMIWWSEYNDRRWPWLSIWKAAGLIPWLPLATCQSLGKALNSKLVPMSRLAPGMAASAVSVWICVWMGFRANITRLFLNGQYLILHYGMLPNWLLN